MNKSFFPFFSFTTSLSTARFFSHLNLQLVIVCVRLLLSNSNCDCSILFQCNSERDVIISTAYFVCRWILFSSFYLFCATALTPRMSYLNGWLKKDIQFNNSDTILLELQKLILFPYTSHTAHRILFCRSSLFHTHRTDNM